MPVYNKLIKLTPEIANEIGQFHLAFGFDTLVVEISVEHDDGKRKKKYRVRPMEMFHQLWVTLAETT